MDAQWGLWCAGTAFWFGLAFLFIRLKQHTLTIEELRRQRYERLRRLGRRD